MPETKPELKRIPLYIDNKQSSVRVPADMWKQMKMRNIETNESLNTQMVKLLADHFKTADQTVIFSELEKLNANELINKLLEEYFQN